MRALFALAALLLAIASVAVPVTVAAQPLAHGTASPDEGAWHALAVPGGNLTLEHLGVPAGRERAGVMIELIRRLHFSEDPTKLEATLLELQAAVADLDGLRNAIALASISGQPPSIALAVDKKTRKRLQDALESAGLDLKESKKQYRAALKDDDSAGALRRRLALVGVDVEVVLKTVNDGGPLEAAPASIELPLPLPLQVWSKVVFERQVHARHLFIAILTDPSARLLYHGLAGMDASTRRWMASQPDLLRRIYRDTEAVRSFALFGPAIHVSEGQVVVPGGPVGARRWSSVLDADPARADRFVRRLLDHNGGRSAGLYFAIAAADAPRQRFLLSANATGNGVEQRFERLVSSFANCYPSNSTLYPFVLRSHDAALFLLEINITSDGELAGPVWRRFWQRVFDGDALPENPVEALRNVSADGPVDPAWLVDALCAAPSSERGSVFVTALAGQRVFAHAKDSDLPEVLTALRMRRLYPAVFMAMEHARVVQPRTYAAIASHAARLARLDSRERSVTALRLFQGALALTLNAITATTLDVDDGERLLQSLADVRLVNEHYDGRIADWLVENWIPAVGGATGAATAEEIAARAIAGPVSPAASTVSWEGQDYVVDIGGTGFRRLLGVRKRQGGLTLDTVLELRRISYGLRQSDLTASRVELLQADLQRLTPRLRELTAAAEYGSDGLNVDQLTDDAIKDLSRGSTQRELKRAAEVGADLTRVIDFLLAHVLAAWAYAPHVGEADRGALLGGDPSLHHLLGVDAPPSSKFVQRWEVGLPAGPRRSVSGSFLGLEAALASWSLHRLQSDTVPPPPTIGGNDLISFMLTAALSDPRRFDEERAARIVAALDAGSAIIRTAGSDAAALAKAADAGAVSPWRREVLGWLATNEPRRIEEQFSVTERARIGGLAQADAQAWGSVSIVTGCLCLQMPQLRIPEVIVGRAADGILGGRNVDLTLRVTQILHELKVPASLTAPVLGYAMRDFLDGVKPTHAADFDAFARQALALSRSMVEDYLGAIAAIGPLRPVPEQ